MYSSCLLGFSKWQYSSSLSCVKWQETMNNSWRYVGPSQLLPQTKMLSLWENREMRGSGLLGSSKRHYDTLLTWVKQQGTMQNSQILANTPLTATWSLGGVGLFSIFQWPVIWITLCSLLHYTNITLVFTEQNIGKTIEKQHQRRWGNEEELKGMWICLSTLPHFPTFSGVASLLFFLCSAL